MPERRAAIFGLLALLVVTAGIVVIVLGGVFEEDAEETPPDEAEVLEETPTPVREVGTARPTQRQEGEAMTLIETVDQVRPAVVTVSSLLTVGGLPGSQDDVQAGTGTGFIIDEQGHVVTNWHVVAGGADPTVFLADGTEVDAELVGEDPQTDLAVLRINPSMVPATVPLGNSRQLQPGQTVMAIGSPLGAFSNTVTAGIISALNRDQLADPTSIYCQNYTDLIQHDAAINQGNSGGPLINLYGEVVGVNTLGIRTSQSGLPVQGLSFAVPSTAVQEVVDELINQGRISTPYTGAMLVELTPRIAAANNLPVESGAFVDGVRPDSPAEQAGLLSGDIITALDGEQITPERTLAQMLAAYEPGDTVDLTVLRDGAEVSVSLTFGEVPPGFFEQCISGQP